MPVIAPIVLNDGQATPVAHTFQFAEASPGRIVMEDRALGIYVGFNKLTLALARPKGPTVAGQSRNLKLGMRIETPIPEVVSNSTFSGIAPAPQVAYRPVIDLNATLPERSTRLDRKNLRLYTIGLLQSAAGIAMFEDLELMY